MQKTRFTKWLSLILCMVLIAAMALCLTGCNSDTKAEAPTDTTVETETPADTEVKVMGEGATSFPLTVTDAEGKETAFEIHTDKATVGEALLELELIAGDEGAYGLYVKTVNGITVDYDKDGKYWAFYIDGQYATSGVDTTKITEGATYALKVE